jgi:hypothetical protein
MTNLRYLEPGYVLVDIDPEALASGSDAQLDKAPGFLRRNHIQFRADSGDPGQPQKRPSKP